MVSPRCPIVLHIGVTGHRNFPNADFNSLSWIVSNILARLRAMVETIRQRDQAAKDPLFLASPPVLRCISSLAAGADSLVAECGLQLGYELHAPIPFHSEVYAKDFVTDSDRKRWSGLMARASAVFQMDGEREWESEAYLAAGRVVLDHSDILIAVWDGLPARGRGGTGHIVAEAQERGLPTLVIDSMAPHTVRFTDGRGNTTNTDWAGCLETVVEHILLPFRSDEEGGQLPWRYFHETGRTIDTAASVASVKSWVDTLANRYAQRFRTSALLRSLLAIPVIGGIFVGFYLGDSSKPLGFGLQAVSVFAIYALTRLTAGQEWHQRFVDYRLLAEHLRHAEALAALGHARSTIHYSAHQSSTQSIWIDWYFRSLSRLDGMPSTRLDTAELTRIRDLISRDIEGQIGYYTRSSQRCGRRADILEKLGMGLYASGLAIILSRFVCFWLLGSYLDGTFFGMTAADARSRLNEVALVLPALAPIFLGIRSQAEYPRLAKRYEVMVAKLKVIKTDLDNCTLHRQALLSKLVNVTDMMLDEVSDWRVLIRSKTLSPV